MLRNGPLEIDVDRFTVRIGGQTVPFGGLQLKLLLHLARHSGGVCTRDEILSAVWGPERPPRGQKTVDVLICRLRKRLGVAAPLLTSVRSFGYRLNTAPQDPRD